MSRGSSLVKMVFTLFKILHMFNLLLYCKTSGCPQNWNTCTDPDLSHTSKSSNILLKDIESRLSSLERRLRAVEQPVWQIGTTHEDWEICAEGPCKCVPETKSLSCWRYGLLDVPPSQVVPNDILKLDLGSNQMTALHRDTFLDMTQLNQFAIHLRISKNLLRELHQNQFVKVRNLRILDASSNRLQTLPESLFIANSVLVLLDFSNNLISYLPNGTFHGLKTLEELLLSHNRLTTLQSGVFRDLINTKCLKLDNNRLGKLPADIFHQQISLEELNLRGNLLTEIPNKLFSSLEQLLTLELSGNRLTHINPLAFDGLVSLKELQLGQNSIKTLTPGLFDSVMSLERLVLYANSIEVLSKNTFRGLNNLTSLFLHSNRLRLLHPELFKDTPNLRKLLLEANYLSYLPARILDGLVTIRQLRLERNPWHCDCSAAYLATWLQRRYLIITNSTSIGEMNIGDNSKSWEFGAGVICRGPGTMGGKLLLRLTFHELCEGQWASMKGLVPRLPKDVLGTPLSSIFGKVAEV
ncbi:PREDICTED: carboxypeptidase N subunit 2-like isoform X2 [Polistes dominula]|uniref:Carboxypeptidase N subunit 2-like isoform X2 n=1 Tax=Polistes dominula TaxID=743375 RepID=A0ABM1HVS3_POLDO|nr:PREDICTED: carboxypeptidase N subunit 2-like isoform X2 [Polistes dominula]